MANKLHFIFLNRTFSDADGNIKLFQIVENNEDEYVINTRVVTLEELTKLYNDGINDNSIKFDFKIDNGYLQSENVSNSKLSDAELNKIKGVTSRLVSPITNIYNLFTDIVDNQGYYIDMSEEENLGKENMIEGMTSFIPNYSKSTMTVSLSVNTREGWRTRKLIYVDEGKLVTDNFLFCVNENKKDLFKKYNIDYIGDFIIRDAKRSVFRFTGNLSIYAFGVNSINVYPSILNRYTFMSELYDNVYKSADYICRTLSEAINGPEEKEKKQQDRSLYVSKYTKSYVTFELARKRITMDDRNFFIQDIVSNLEENIRSKKYGMKEVVEHVRKLNLDYMERLVYFAIFDILINAGNLPMDRIEKCIMVSKDYRIRKFKADTFLYMFRSYLYFTDGKLGIFRRLILSGSDIPYETVLKRRTVND